MAFSNIGEHNKAVQDISKFIEIYPHNPMGYYFRGNEYYLISNKDEDAINDFNKAISICLSYKLSDLSRSILSHTYYMRAHIYANKLGRYKEAIIDFNKSISINPQNLEKYIYNELADSHFNLGKNYCKMGKYIAAIKEFNYAIGINTHKLYSEESDIDSFEVQIFGRLARLNSTFYYH